MNAITSILTRLPKAKTSADFDAALADLECEHAEATAAVGRLEAQREDLTFTGGDLAKLETDITAAEGTAKKRHFGWPVSGEARSSHRGHIRLRPRSTPHLPAPPRGVGRNPAPARCRNRRSPAQTINRNIEGFFHGH